MCLYYYLKPKQASKIKAEARKRGYIRVWKVCGYKETGWCFGLKWKKGLRKSAHIKSRDGGWYAYLSKEEAESRIAFWPYHEIKVCYAKPKWIKRLGEDMGKRKSGIFTHLAFPNWDKGDMTIREFRAMCKGKK